MYIAIGIQCVLLRDYAMLWGREAVYVRLLLFPGLVTSD